jgi:hypothetical protein
MDMNKLLMILAANVDIYNRGRIDAKQTAQILGFQEHDIPVVVSEGLLEPLGKPGQNCRKYFARVQIMDLAEDAKWLSKATNVLYEHWQGKNASRKSNEGEGESSHAE